MDATKIGKRIQTARKQTGMTQQALAQHVGLTAKYISNIECGLKLPLLETFVAIANALETDANSLLCDDLQVSDKILSNDLWQKLSELSAEKRATILKVVDLLADEI